MKKLSEMTDDEMKKVIGAYVAADTAVGKLDDGRAKKTELQAKLAELKKTVEEIESKYAQKVIESIYYITSFKFLYSLFDFLFKIIMRKGVFITDKFEILIK